MNELPWHLAVILLAALIVVNSILLVATMRQLGGISLRIAPAHPGDIEGGPEIGAEVMIPGWDPVRAGLVLFMSPDCSLCAQLVPAIAGVRRGYPELQLVAAVRATSPEARDQYAKQLGSYARSDLESMFGEWSIPGTPYAVGIDGNGRVAARGVTNSLEHLEVIADGVVSRTDELARGSRQQGPSSGPLEAEPLSGEVQQS
jgi:hypothetical protein